MTCVRSLITAGACLLGAQILAGCGSSGDGAGESDSELRDQHFPANYCEVFVDRATVTHSSHGSTIINLFLKAPVDKLAGRGGIKAVGMFARESSRGQSPTQFFDHPAMRFVGSADYWEASFPIGS